MRDDLTLVEKMILFERARALGPDKLPAALRCVATIIEVGEGAAIGPKVRRIINELRAMAAYMEEE